MNKMIDDFYHQAESFDEDGDAEEELRIYDQLFELVPDDETVAFNRGVIQFDLGKYEDAAESFIVSAFNRNDDDIRDDSEDYLNQILEELPENLSILHSLASLAMENGDGELIEKFYSRIIEIDPSDPLSHLNLGHYYYADNLDDELARGHFKRFLELSPGSDEAEEIKNILDEME